MEDAQVPGVAIDRVNPLPPEAGRGDAADGVEAGGGRCGRLQRVPCGVFPSPGQDEGGRGPVRVPRHERRQRRRVPVDAAERESVRGWHGVEENRRHPQGRRPRHLPHRDAPVARPRHGQVATFTHVHRRPRDVTHVRVAARGGGQRVCWMRAACLLRDVQRVEHAHAASQRRRQLQAIARPGCAAIIAAQTAERRRFVVGKQHGFGVVGWSGRQKKARDGLTGLA